MPVVRAVARAAVTVSDRHYPDPSICADLPSTRGNNSMTHIATCSNCMRLVLNNIDSHRQLFEKVPSYRVVRRRGPHLIIEYCLSPVGPDHYKRIEDEGPE